MSAGSARPDHYATLGVTPGASAAEVRAAYLALLREHHPDRNNSPEAVDRTKAIITAFKVLGDFDQRSYYDWDRRRDREAAEAAAAGVPRRRAKAGLATVGIGLAAVGAWLLVPGAIPERAANAPRTATVEPERKAAAPVRTAAAARPTAERRERDVTLIRMRPTLPKAAAAPAEATAAEAKAAETKLAARLAKNDPPKPVSAKAAPKPAERVAALKATPPRQAQANPPRQAQVAPPRVTKAVAPPPPIRVAAKPAPVVRLAAKPAPAAPNPRQSSARSATDLASLDQFVMNFYGQSWRYGDAPKRSKLEQTRAGFVVRRGACVAETCKRAAYLKLMRDVSQIVESDPPKAR